MKHRTRLALYWLDKADESLNSATSELEAGRLTFAVNRLYYAMFYAVSALFAAKNLSYGKHSAVRSALHREFIKPGLIGRSLGRLYDELFNARQQGDYVPLVEFDREVVNEQVNDVGECLPQLRQLVTRLVSTYEESNGV
jgi:uncharacterized protein (UPF0332 family)